MADTKIRIVSEAAGDGFQKTEADLKSLEAAAGRVAASTSGVNQAANPTLQTIGDFPGAASAAGSAAAALTLATAGAVAGFVALKNAAGAALDEFGQKETAVISLDAALANAGQLTTEYRERLQELAQSLEETTTIADEKWLAVLRRLTQFGANASNIDQYAEAVKNLAGIMGGDIEGAGELFSRAMVGSFEMLGRYGIHVDASRTKTEQFSEVLEQISLRGLGQLEAQAAGLAGKSRSLANAWSQLRENLGNLIAPQAKAGLDLINGAVTALGNLLPSTVKKVGDLTNRENSLADAALTAGRAFATEMGQMEGQNTTIEKLIKNTTNLNAIKAGEKARADAITKAKLDRDMAAVEAREKDGRLSPEAAIVAKDSLKAAAENEMFQRGQKARAEEIRQNEILLSQLEGQRRLAEHALSSDDDEETRKTKLLEVAKATAAEDTQRAKNTLENPRLKAEIANAAEERKLKDETRRIGAQADARAAREKADQEEYARNRSPISARPKSVDEEAVAEKARKAEDKAAKEKFDAENEKRAKRGARPLEEDEFLRLESNRAKNKANAEAANAPADFKKLFPKKTPVGSTESDPLGGAAKASESASAAVSESSGQLQIAANSIDAAAGAMLRAAGRFVAAAEKFEDADRRLAAVEANVLNA